MPLQVVEVVRHLDRVGEIIHEDILLPRTPFEHELKSVPYTGIEDVCGVKLKGWVWGTLCDELTPLLAIHQQREALCLPW